MIFGKTGPSGVTAGYKLNKLPLPLKFKEMGDDLKIPNAQVYAVTIHSRLSSTISISVLESRKKMKDLGHHSMTFTVIHQVI